MGNDRTDTPLTDNTNFAACEHLTLIRVFEVLPAPGYEGGYNAVRHYALRWDREHWCETAAAHVQLSFAAGEAYQVDWSQEIVVGGDFFG